MPTSFPSSSLPQGSRTPTPPTLGGGGAHLPLDAYDPFSDEDADTLAYKADVVAVTRMIGMAFELWRNGRRETQIKTVSGEQRLEVVIRRNTCLSGEPYRWIVMVYGLLVEPDQMARLRGEIVSQIKRSQVLDFNVLKDSMWPMAVFDGNGDDDRKAGAA